MEIILNETIKKLGNKGQIVKVKPGYARNFLIPKGLAVTANIVNKKVAEEDRIQAAYKAQNLVEEAKTVAKKLDATTIVIKVKSGGDTGKIFGSITPLQITEAIYQRHKIKIDPKKIDIAKSIKLIGKYDIEIKIHEKVSCTIVLDVQKE